MIQLCIICEKEKDFVTRFVLQLAMPYATKQSKPMPICRDCRVNAKISDLYEKLEWEDEISISIKDKIIKDASNIDRKCEELDAETEEERRIMEKVRVRLKASAWDKLIKVMIHK